MYIYIYVHTTYTYYYYKASVALRVHYYTWKPVGNLLAHQTSNKLIRTTYLITFPYTYILYLPCIYRYYNILYYLVCAYTQAHEMGEWDIKSFSDLILLYYCKRHRSYTAACTISNVGTTIRARVCAQHTNTQTNIHYTYSRIHRNDKTMDKYLCIHFFFRFCRYYPHRVFDIILYYDGEFNDLSSSSSCPFSGHVS